MDVTHTIQLCDIQSICEGQSSKYFVASPAMGMPENPGAAGLWMKERRKELNLTAAELAERITALANAQGDQTVLSQQVVSKFEKGENKRFPAWGRFIEKALDVSARSEIGSINEVVPIEGDGNGVVHITKLDLAAAMGDGTIVGDYVGEEQVAFDASFIRALTRTPARFLRMITGVGDSMHPTLVGGDVIIVDTTVRSLVRQDGIYWIRLFEAHAIKRLRAVAVGRVMVKSDNPIVEDQEVDADDLKIEGRAIWVSRAL